MLAGIGLISFVLAYVGASVGLVLGQFRLPLLIAVLGSPASGVATNLAVSSLGAWTGAVSHLREGRVQLRLLLTIALPSAIAAFVTVRLGARLDPRIVEVGVGLALLVSASTTWRRARAQEKREAEEAAGGAAEGAEPAEQAEQVEKAEPAPTQDAVTARGIALELGMGTVLGGLSGLVGLLLGSLRLPAMLRLGIEPDQAVGTNMLIGAITGTLAAVGSLFDQGLSLLALGIVGPLTVLGSFLGARQTGRFDKKTLNRVIAVTLLVIAIYMLGHAALAG